MLRFKTSILVIVLVSSFVFITTTLEDNEKHTVNLKKHNPTAVERGIGITKSLTSWDQIKGRIKVAWLNFSPSPWRAEKSHKNVGEVVKEAVAKSFETSKEAGEKSAKAAGHTIQETAEKVKDTAGHAAHETADKVKRTFSHSKQEM